MNIYLVLYLLFSHWVGDFLFQTTWMATNKWNNDKALLAHTTVYSLTMLVFLIPLLNLSFSSLAIFIGITFVFHTIQDWFTSKITHMQFEEKKYNGWNGAFTIIGFDQWLHFIQLLLTYLLLSN